MFEWMAMKNYAVGSLLDQHACNARESVRGSWVGA